MEEQANNVNRFLLILSLGGGVVMEQYGWVRARCVHGGNERASIEHSQWHKASDDVRSSNSFDLAFGDSVCFQCLIGAWHEWPETQRLRIRADRRKLSQHLPQRPHLLI